MRVHINMKKQGLLIVKHSANIKPSSRVYIYIYIYIYIYTCVCVNINMKNQGIQRMSLSIVKHSANVKHFTFFFY